MSALQSKIAATKAAHGSPAARLSDSYVKGLLTKGTSLTSADIPPAFVELKRAHLLLTRELRNHRAQPSSPTA